MRAFPIRLHASIIGFYGDSLLEEITVEITEASLGDATPALEVSVGSPDYRADQLPATIMRFDGGLFAQANKKPETVTPTYWRPGDRPIADADIPYYLSSTTIVRPPSYFNNGGTNNRTDPFVGPVTDDERVAWAKKLARQDFVFLDGALYRRINEPVIRVVLGRGQGTSAFYGIPLTTRDAACTFRFDRLGEAHAFAQTFGGELGPQIPGGVRVISPDYQPSRDDVVVMAEDLGETILESAERFLGPGSDQVARAWAEMRRELDRGILDRAGAECFLRALASFAQTIRVHENAPTLPKIAASNWIANNSVSLAMRRLARFEGFDPEEDAVYAPGAVP